MRTPTTRPGLEQYDHLPAEEAILRAWTEPGAAPDYHRYCQRLLRAQIPVLARALDRFAAIQPPERPMTETERTERRNAIAEAFGRMKETDR